MRLFRTFGLMILTMLFVLTEDPAEAKVLIITHSYNRPDFIEIQDMTFKRFMKEDYEFVVFNDAQTEKMCQQIFDTCRKLNLTCLRIPQSIHDAPYLHRFPGEDYNNPSVRCANVVQYSLDVLGFDHDGLVVLLDSDMFLIRDFSVADYLGEREIAGIPQTRGPVHYLWNGLMFLNMNTLPDKRSLNFNCGIVEGQHVDTAGFTYYYFQQHPEVKVAVIPHYYIDKWTTLTEDQNRFQSIAYLYSLHPDNIEFMLDHTFLHYRSGGNWDQRSVEYHARKTQILKQFIEFAMEMN